MDIYTICKQSLIPLRAEPREQSEMVTQMLFGETAIVVEVREKWLHIELTHDKYTGWIDRKMGDMLSPQAFNQCHSENYVVFIKPFSKIGTSSGEQIIPLGSVFRNNMNIRYEATDVSEPNLKTSGITRIAKTLLNAPYLWGGKSVFGMDCSGFVQLLMRLAGIELPRDAHQQALLGEKVTILEQVKEGDLAFFGEHGRISHVGYLINKSEIIHASGYVRIDTLNEKGIWQADTKKQTHSLISIKRFL